MPDMQGLRWKYISVCNCRGESTVIRVISDHSRDEITTNDTVLSFPRSFLHFPCSSSVTEEVQVQLVEASSITIAQLKGQYYPSDDIINSVLRKHFSISRRVCTGDVFAVRVHPLDHSICSPTAHFVEELSMLLWFAVEKIDVLGSDRNDFLCQECSSIPVYITSPNSTRIILDAKVSETCLLRWELPGDIPPLSWLSNADQIWDSKRGNYAADPGQFSYFYNSTAQLNGYTNYTIISKGCHKYLESLYAAVRDHRADSSGQFEDWVLAEYGVFCYSDFTLRDLMSSSKGTTALAYFTTVEAAVKYNLSSLSRGLGNHVLPTLANSCCSSASHNWTRLATPGILIHGKCEDDLIASVYDCADKLGVGVVLANMSSSGDRLRPELSIRVPHLLGYKKPSTTFLLNTNDLTNLTYPYILCVTGIRSDLYYKGDYKNQLYNNLKSLIDGVYTKMKTSTEMYQLCSLSNRMPEYLKRGVCVVGTTVDSIVEPFPQYVYDMFPFSYPTPLISCASLEQMLTSRLYCSRSYSYDAKKDIDSRSLFNAIEEIESFGFSHLDLYVNDSRITCLSRACIGAWKHTMQSLLMRPMKRSFIASDSRLIALSRADILSVESSRKLGSWLRDKDQSRFEKPVVSSSNVDHVCSNISWEDIGGMQGVKAEIMDDIWMYQRNPEVLNSFSGRHTRALPRHTGVLLHGPPGTGKTLVAKAIANECGMSFISVKGPELLDMYVGESERHVREIFSEAKRLSPCILFFDELDSLAPARGMSGSSGVMDRVVSQLISEIDTLGVDSPPSSTGFVCVSDNDNANMQHKSVFIIGATNRPDLIDPALLRPGRFERKIYMGPCQDTESIAHILAAQTRKFQLHESVCLKEIAASLQMKQITGASLAALVSHAYYQALDRKISELQQRHQLEEGDPCSPDIVLTHQDFMTSADSLYCRTGTR